MCSNRLENGGGGICVVWPVIESVGALKVVSVGLFKDTFGTKERRGEQNEQAGDV